MRLTAAVQARQQFKYWQRFVETRMQHGYIRQRYHPIAGWAEKRREFWHYDKHRAWTDEAQGKNRRMEALEPDDLFKKRNTVVPIKDWKIFREDRKELIGGALGFHSTAPTLTRNLRLGNVQQFSLRNYHSFATPPLASKVIDQSRAMSTDKSIPEGVLFGLGNPLLDITVKTDLEFLEKYNLKANNAILAGPEHMPLFEEIMNDFKPEYGAGGATQNSIRIAQWLLQTPLATTYTGGVGLDERAQILRAKAEEAGVKVLYCVSDLGPTGVCGALITGVQRSLVAHLGAADFFTHEWLHLPEQWQYVEKAQVFYIGGFVFPVCNEGIFDIAKHACSERKTLAMNLSAPFLCKYYADPRHNIMQYVDILFGNEAEAAEFCKLQGIATRDIREMALHTSLLPKANDARGRMVVFTQGRDPTIIAKDGEVYTFPINPVPKELIRDTNGCGDSFVGGFLAQLVRGKDIDECVRCGNYAARYIIQQWGCKIGDRPDFE